MKHNITPLLLALLAAPLVHAQIDRPAPVPRQLTPRETEAREQAVQGTINRLSPRPLPPQTAKRLHDILINPDPVRMEQSLIAWLDELQGKELNSAVTDEAVVVLTCLMEQCRTSTAHKAVLDHILARVRRCFSSPKPVDDRELQNMLNRVVRWEFSALPESMAIVDAINGAWPRSAEYFAYKPGAGTSLSLINMLWSNPRGYAPFLLSLNNPVTNARTGKLLYDADTLERMARLNGVRHWRFPWGCDLPPTVDQALTLMAARRHADMPSADAVKKLVESGKESPAGMRGFMPRCVLGTDPGAVAWKPLSDSTASLFEMPDVSAVQLAQWSDSLLGPKTKLKDDFAALEGQLDALVKDKTLPALLVYSLVEDDLSLPNAAHRPWMDVDGYDTCRAVALFEVTADGVEVVIDEKGPHFSKNDPKLRAAYRSLNLALHRCVLRMALLERDGKTELLYKAADRLAADLNKSKAWPLLWNQYSLRGVSPRAFLRLIEGFKGRRSLLAAFPQVVGGGCADVVTDLEGMGERLSPKRVAELLRDYWICYGVLKVSAQERDATVKRFLEMERKYLDKPVAGTLPWLVSRQLPDALTDATADAPEHYRSSECLRGLASVARAIEKGDLPAAKAMFRTMAPEGDSTAWSYLGTRLAAARIARAEGREAEAARLEQDAVALTAYYHGICGKTIHPRLAVFALLRQGLVQEADRLITLLSSYTDQTREEVAKAYAAKGMYGAAAFHMECLVHNALCQSAPSCFGCGTHRDVAAWRTAADLYHAAFFRKNGHPDWADRLEQAARKAQPKLAAAVDLSAPAVQEDCTLPQELRSTTSPFESPYYTWHLRGFSDEGPVTVEAKILYAHLSEISQNSNWVQLSLRSGRLLCVGTNDLPSGDIANLKDWMQRNGLQQWHPGLTVSFFGKPLQMVQDKPFPRRALKPNGIHIVSGKRVVFLNMWGQRCSHYTEAMKEPDRSKLESSMQPVHGPETKLRTFATVAEAESDAMLNNRNLLCLLLGKHGGPADKAFRAMEKESPDTVGEWNFAFSIVPCYCDDAGNWEPEARRVLDFTAPALELLPAQGTPAWERELSSGIGLELPTTGFGNTVNENTSDRPVNVLPRFIAPCQDVSDSRIAEFYAAVKAKDAAKVERMLTESPALANAPLQMEYPNPLFAALFTFNAPVVESLLKHGANPNAINNNGVTVLHAYTFLPPAPAVLAALLKHGANPNAVSRDYSHNTSTYPLCVCKDARDLETLAAAGADVSKCDGGGYTALAINSYNAALVDLLCGKFKANPNQRAYDGTHPVAGNYMVAQYPDAVDKLLHYGMDPYATLVDANAATPRPIGATNQVPGAGALAHRSTPDNRAVFVYLLASTPKFREMLNVMEKHKVDFSRKDVDGNEILGHLLARGKASTFEFLDELIKHGADIHATFNGKPLLYHLVEASYMHQPSMGQMNQKQNSPYQDLLRALDALVAHGLDPYQPFGDFQDIFEYADSQTTDEMGITRPCAAKSFKPILNEWKAKHPKGN